MTDRATFTVSSAERIAKVVRTVEAGNRDGSILPVSPRFAGSLSGGSAVRFCSWTGTWGYNGINTIAFASGPPATATAINVILGVGAGDGWVARRGSAGWSLVAFDMTKQPGYAPSEIQLFGHSTSSGAAQWYSITNCSTATT